MSKRRAVEISPSFESALASIPRTAATAQMLFAAVEDLERRADAYPPVEGTPLRALALVGWDEVTPTLNVFFRIEEEDDRVVLIHVGVTRPEVEPSYEAAVPRQADAGDSQHAVKL